MKIKQYDQYALDECKRQWAENQEEVGLGKWEEQTAQQQEDYYNEMFSLLKDNF